MPAWYTQHGGKVLSFAIDKYCYISCRELPPFFAHKYRLVYSRIETVSEIDQIAHPALREGIREFAPQLRLEIQHHGDLPARSGIGSSSAFAVGLIHGLRQLNNVHVPKYELALSSIYLEQKLIQEVVGSQDQIACSFGGLNLIQFGPGIGWRVNPIVTPPSRLFEIENRCFLVFSGIQRLSSQISEGLLNNFESKSSLMRETLDLTIRGVNLLESSDNLDEIGNLLNVAWRLKRESNPFASSSALSDFIDCGIKSGAIGAKVLGAGGGGFVLFWLKFGDKDRFRKTFNLGVEVPFKIDFSGSTILMPTDREKNV